MGAQAIMLGASSNTIESPSILMGQFVTHLIWVLANTVTSFVSAICIAVPHFAFIDNSASDAIILFLHFHFFQCFNPFFSTFIFLLLSSFEILPVSSLLLFNFLFSFFSPEAYNVWKVLSLIRTLSLRGHDTSPFRFFRYSSYLKRNVPPSFYFLFSFREFYVTKQRK